MAKGSGVEGRCGDDESEVGGGLNGSGVGARAADDGAPLTSWSKGKVMVSQSIAMKTTQNQRPRRPSTVVMAGWKRKEKIGRGRDADRGDIIASAFPTFQTCILLTCWAQICSNS